MMINGTDVVMMPGMMLAWILVGFATLLLVAVLVTWLTTGMRSRRRGDKTVMEDFEDMGREQVTRDVITGKVVDERAVGVMRDDPAPTATEEALAGRRISPAAPQAMADEQQLEREHEEIRQQQRFKRAS